MIDFAQLLLMCAEFFATGLLAFGGGMATIPFLKGMGARHGWFNDNDVLNMLAVSESTPGPIGVNMATYVGFATFGVLGGILTTISLVLPSLITILIISVFLDKFRKSRAVETVFTVLRPASLGLIAASVLDVAKSTFLHIPETGFDFSQFFSIIDIRAIIFAVILFVGMRFFKKLHPIVFIAISAVVGIIFQM